MEATFLEDNMLEGVAVNRCMHFVGFELNGDVHED
jgi:hypothetical protein